MATHLDLEEQEQLDQLKHFWNTYGNLITAVIVLAALVFMGWNGWQYYERNKAASASALYDELQRGVESGDTARVERALADMKDKFSGTAYAQQAGLLAAKALRDKGNLDASRAALTWVSDKAIDPGYQAIARLRLAAELMEAKSYDDALKQLAAPVPREFEALVADRKGDIYMAQGKRDEAKAEYQKAWTAFDERAEYRRLVEIKLNAVGVDPQTLKAAAPVKNNS
ncbi:tetratricopeptide repeat protein [Variovorax sp. J22R133]|uniref:YfgM family protein n=1 Tax=Variovorax brevis TaxID=3053503 RepID=UPI002577B88B|nr:tetratricopeptide repeat protein [Variovorax sp. J22R133]MDM0112174.1 tetratricopeptide repeat protein [Variovorax sp. J22R133]